MSVDRIAIPAKNCAVCGKPTSAVESELPSMFAALNKLPVICSACEEQRRRATDSAAEHQARRLRENRWAEECPKRFQDTELFDLPNQAKTAAAMRWKYGPKGLVLYGQSFQGKSRTAYLIVRREWIDNRRDFLFTSHRDIEVYAQRTMKTDPGEYYRWLARLETVPVLYIDDLGKSNFVRMDGKPKMSEEILFNALDKRFNEGLPVIITCNGAFDQIAGAMSTDRGIPLLNRINESCFQIGF